MKNSIRPTSIQDYIGAFILMIAFFTGIIIFWNSTKSSKEVLIKPPQCENTFAEYQNLVEKGQSVLLTPKQYSYAIGGKFIGDKKVLTRRQGEVACGYIFVSANKGTKPLDDTYDSIYINPQGLGGHLLRSRGISIENPENTATQVLFSLDNISYLPNVPYNPNAQNFEIANWVNLINASNKTEFIIALSTTSSVGVINEVRVAYKCYNPETGQETKDCQLSLE